MKTSIATLAVAACLAVGPVYAADQKDEVDCYAKYPTKAHMTQAYALAAVQCILDQTARSNVQTEAYLKAHPPQDDSGPSPEEAEYDMAIFNAKMSADTAAEQASRPYQGIEPFNPGIEYYRARYDSGRH